ncbi:MAG: hypothetical protein H7249_14580 [Chitinophagaceae bacterium]|nr:hypothetical protein [Oligoflexus sp.]
MHVEWYHGVIAVSVILLIGIGFGIWYLRRPLPKLLESPAIPLPLEPIHLKFQGLNSFNAHSKIINGQSAEWRESMKRSGASLKASKVKRIILLHGTFVGSDPANIFSSLRFYFPKMSKKIEGGMSKRMRGLIDHVAQDNGNFIPAYTALLEEALHANIPVSLQYWSSANHHLARLEGAVSLLEQIGHDFPKKADDRILLMGHSHARQVFALFTHLIQGSGTNHGLGHALWQFLAHKNLAPHGLRDKAKALRKQRFDFVTLGGPVRYSWSFVDGMRVLHIVNHEGDTTAVKSPWAFWNTSGGDFVQQWGMIGSDNLSPTPRERTLNRELDTLLGKGWHTRLWLRSIVRRERLGDFGRTLLIDYQRATVHRNNFIIGVFGHGVYTRFEVMEYQMKLIAEYIYS